MEPPANQRQARRLITILAIVLGTFVAYLPAMNGGWLWDDDVHVTKNPSLRDSGGLARLWLNVGVTPQYYPLTHTSFWVQYQLWQTTSTIPYHVVNVILHAASAVLLGLILESLKLKGAWLAAAIFALHPVHVESVAWISERKNTLCGFFYLIGAACLLRSMEKDRVDWRWYAWGTIAFAAALLSKTVAASLPAAVLLVLFWKQNRLKRRQVLAMVPLLIVGAAMGQLTAWMERTHVGASGPEWDFSFLQRLQIAGMAIWFYVYKLLAPIGLSFIYPQWEVRLENPLRYLFPILALAVLFALMLGRKRFGNGPLIGALFFVGTLFPALGFVNVYPMRYSFVADHFVYLASIGLIAMVAALLFRAGKWSIAVPIVLALLTFQRAGIFHDETTLWEDTVDKNPRAWIAHDQLGAIAADRREFDVAAGHFAQALAIEPQQIEGHMGLGSVHLANGNFGAAIEQMRMAVAMRPDKPLPHYSLAYALAAARDFPAAIEEFETTLRIDQRFIPAHLRLADIYDMTGRPDEAAQHRAKARELMRAFQGDDPRP